MNHFGYNAKSTIVVFPKIPPVLKEKFISCESIVPPRMSTVELWDTGGPLVSVGPARLSQSTHNNLVGGFTPPIDVFASKPPQSECECNRTASNQRPSTLCKQHMNEAYHNAKQIELDENWAYFFY
jgi:hypothetical protein